MKQLLSDIFEKFPGKKKLKRELKTVLEIFKPVTFRIKFGLLLHLTLLQYTNCLTDLRQISLLTLSKFEQIH